MKSGVETVSPAVGVLLAVSLSVLLNVVCLQALSGEVELSGVVRDPSGTAVAGASVTVVDPASGTTRTALTDKSGQYRIPDLPSGTYHLQAQFSGFAPYSLEVTLEEGGPRSLDVMLKLPNRKESVTITGAYTPLATTQRNVDASDQARSLNAAGSSPTCWEAVCGAMAHWPVSRSCTDWTMSG